MTSPNRRQLLLASLSGTSLCASGSSPQQVIYPAPETPQDTRADDLVVLLRAALERTLATHGPYRLAPASQFMTLTRVLRELRPNGLATVGWVSPVIQEYAQLLPIKVDTRRGLLGLRLLLIKGSRQAEFDRVRTLADLRRFSLGQEVSWPDARMFEALGIKVVRSTHYRTMFRMLMADRFDAFPRGVNEAFDEQQAHVAELPDLAVDKSLLLHFPWPFHFVVGPHNTALAERLELGLKLLAADGSFDRHLWDFHGDAVRRAKLRERQLIWLGQGLPEGAQGKSDLEFWLREPPPKDARPRSRNG